LEAEKAALAKEKTELGTALQEAQSSLTRTRDSITKVSSSLTNAASQLRAAQTTIRQPQVPAAAVSANVNNALSSITTVEREVGLIKPLLNFKAIRAAPLVPR